MPLGQGFRMTRPMTPTPLDLACITPDSVGAHVLRTAPVPVDALPPPATLLLTALARHDVGTYHHSLRVACLAAEVCLALACPAWQVRRLWLAGLLHDVGMINVPHSVLKRRGLLTPQERSMLLRHPVSSARLAAYDGTLATLAPGIAAHHERLDGLGFPCGLRGMQIPREAQILAVVEAADALLWPVLSPTPVPTADLPSILLGGASAAWDVSITRAAIHMLGRYGVSPTPLLPLDPRFAAGTETIDGSVSDQTGLHRFE
jgi:hypothetical protein